MSTPVTIRDRRTLPFFMVRLRALEEVRKSISGPRRARALGLYALLCQMANEQRATGEHRRVIATYKQLKGRGGLGSSTVKALLGVLEDAGAARYDVRVDPLRGSVPSLIELPVQDGPWAGVSVAMAERLAAQSAIPLLPALGLLVVLLDLCDEQQGQHGGLVAETTRRDIARRLGCGVDALDKWVKALEGADVLRVSRRRGERGANLPNLWEITEADVVGALPQELPTKNTRADAKAYQGSGPVLREPTTRPGLADDQAHRPRDMGSRPPMPGNAVVDRQECPGGKSATPAPETWPFNARGRDQSELSTTANNNPPTPTAPPAAPAGDNAGTDEETEVIELCRTLLSVLEITRGAGPARRYRDDTAAWHAAARNVLADHPANKVLDAIAYLESDQVIGTKVRSMPDLERHIEDLRHRAHAARRTQVAHEPSTLTTALPWAIAQSHLRQAVSAFGGGGEADALVFLEAKSLALATFTRQVGWRALARADEHMTEIKFAYLAYCKHGTAEAA